MPAQTMPAQLDYLHLADAASEPEPPPGSVGLNPGCPRMRVFADAEDLCRRGIMPMNPFGACHRMLANHARDSDDFVSAVRAKSVAIPGLGGQVVLFARHYLRSDDRDTFFLALRGSNGYVLLARVGEYHSQANDVPEFERFVADATSVTVETKQTWWGYGDDEPFEKLVRETTRCTLDGEGGLRCNGECPTLALASSPAPLNCAALASFDPSTLGRGKAREEGYWGGWDDDFQLYVAARALGVEPDHEPTRLRTIEVSKRDLTLLEVVPGQWVLLDQQVALLTSRRPIRVGPGPGGIYVSSWSGGGARLHRLLLDTHELEPVFPGACGPSASTRVGD